MSKQQYNVGFNVVRYTGNGAATNAISGVGFKPDAIIIYPQLPGTSGSYVGLKTGEDDGSAFIHRSGGSQNYYGEDHIISFDSDGFTVGDGTPLGTNFLNVDGRIYVAICFGDPV